jgi:hypothetical protein
MKRISLSLFSLCFLNFFAYSGISSLAPESFIPVTHVFVPAGFDSNDSVEIFITGYLPNLCYKAPRSEVKLKGENIEIKMTALTVNSFGSYCADVAVPYFETARLGVLPEGVHKILINKDSRFTKIGKIEIAKNTTEAVDEAIYANVEKIEFAKNGRGVTLRGKNPSNCFELDRVIVIDNGSDTYSVLPKLKVVKEKCEKKQIPFSYSFQVPDTLKSEQVLLHVRVMDGKSMNALYNNKPEMLDE